MPPIPQPRSRPFIGHLLEIEGDAQMDSLVRLAKLHGPIYQLNILGRRTTFLSSQKLVDEVCDESRFSKMVHSSLVELRNLAGDGLFTAYNDEPNWDKAHRLLMPAFGPLGIRGMFPKMLDVADQMLMRWERFGDTPVDVADSMTRLTLDTLALCAFDYRFNSFYLEGEHPFVSAMAGSLAEAGARDQRPNFVSNAMLRTRRKYEADIAYMHRVADELLAARRGEPEQGLRGDLLDVMLHGRDPETGTKLSDENIRFQLVTFLVAGHETTSGLLSFAIYLLLQNPAVLERARAAVDAVLGSDPPTLDDLSKLRYVEQVLMETLRLWPTAPAFGVSPHEPTTIAGVYPVQPGDEIMVLLPSLHRDPAVWGEDAETFRPERFSPGLAESLPPNAWKPFGNGRRACIGRGFAMQEAQLVLSMVLQRFDLVAADANYVLRISEQLTLKPDGFLIRARRREPDARAPVQGRNAASSARQERIGHAEMQGASDGAVTLLLLYGGNSGSSEAFARRLAAEASRRGYTAELAPMDHRTGNLPTAGAVIILTASYEGQPPDNARRFMAWLEKLGPRDLDGVRFAVFGCGNRQWARTYQAIPKRADAALEAAGAQRICPRGETDASADFFGGFDAWQRTLWVDVACSLGLEAIEVAVLPAVDVEILSSPRAQALGFTEMREAAVLANRELVDLSSALGRSKRHIEIALPSGMAYEAGDYLAILPRNPRGMVDRALRRFALSIDSQVVVRGDVAGELRFDEPVEAGTLLSDYLELGAPATRAAAAMMAGVSACPHDQAALARLSTIGAYETEILARRVSLLDLLEAHPTCDCPFGTFLSAVPPMRARQYSISSSPLRDGATCSLTVSVQDAPAYGDSRRHQGVASTFLAALAPGTRLSVAVRPAQGAFRLPPPGVPLVLVCAGSGIAPFHGFLQELSIRKAAGERVGRTILFFGCRDPDVDFLYRKELAGWQDEGLVSVRTAFSSIPRTEMRYVQDRIWQDRSDVADLLDRGAVVLVCGGVRMAAAVRESFAAIGRERCNVSNNDSETWLDELERSGRYAVDVFA